MKFISILAEYGITATPRTRRGNFPSLTMYFFYVFMSFICWFCVKVLWLEPAKIILPQTGIDINAGCGQLKSELLRKKKSPSTSCSPAVAVVDTGTTSAGGVEGTPTITVVGAGESAAEESDFDASIAKSAA